MSFETGEPHSGQELSQALSRVVTQGTAFLASMPDGGFFAPQGQAWSPAEHVRHLRKSSAPLVLALKLPRFLLRLRFGSRSAPSRSFARLRELYLAELAAGAGAGRFTPASEPSAANPADRRREIMNGWTAVTVDLTGALTDWSEPALDRQQLPHPVLGDLSVREMLCFTVYHTAHHLRRVQERALGGS
jgi:DinB superfamily